MSLTNRTLIIFKYLWETTDEAHPASLADISAFLRQYEITADGLIPLPSDSILNI